MSLLVDYISSWLYTPETNNENNGNIPHAPPLTPSLKSKETDIVYLVSSDDLLSVKLKPVSNVIPAPARNMPNIDKFQLHMLNQAQLSSILSVKLKPVNRCTKPRVYPPRHPVLQELLLRRTVIC